MIAKRIIPCLDVKDTKVVKGINFNRLEYAGEPVELAKRYYKEGADELVFLDITASLEKRKTMVKIVENVAKEVFIPFTVGGGISSLEDISALLCAGADKVSINTIAVENPEIIKAAAKKFGSQCIVLAVDSKRQGKAWEVFTYGGRKNTCIDVIQWVKKAEKLGAGEILLTSMDADGTKNGYDIELIKAVSDAVNIPVIASGGAGAKEDFLEVFAKGTADAALAASVFHYNKYSIQEIKNYLQQNGVTMRR